MWRAFAKVTKEWGWARSPKICTPRLILNTKSGPARNGPKEVALETPETVDSSVKPKFTSSSVHFASAPHFASIWAQRGLSNTPWKPLSTPRTGIFSARRQLGTLYSGTPLLFTSDVAGQIPHNPWANWLGSTCPAASRWFLIGYWSCPFWQGALRRRGKALGLCRVPATRSSLIGSRWWVFARFSGLAAGRCQGRLPTPLCLTFHPTGMS